MYVLLLILVPLYGWMASLTRWTWVWVNSGSWWWTGRPGMLQFTGSQRVGHDWVTKLNWTMVPVSKRVGVKVAEPCNKWKLGRKEDLENPTHSVLACWLHDVKPVSTACYPSLTPPSGSWPKPQFYLLSSPGLHCTSKGLNWGVISSWNSQAWKSRSLSPHTSLCHKKTKSGAEKTQE